MICIFENSVTCLTFTQIMIWFVSLDVLMQRRKKDLVLNAKDKFAMDEWNDKCLRGFDSRRLTCAALDVH